MKMQGRKATVFIVHTVIYIAIMVLMIFFAKDTLGSIAYLLIGSYMFVSMAYIGGIAFEKFLASKYHGKDTTDD